ncbi:transglycosylase SLT domain-containing protein [Azospirillum canadense]|uniref:transglycosylase SLT domain-containing protein n=1 Tax=Azospirillum canadense TaxID=403962 RepID=UPI0022261AF6|nr:transglycosylase SLT domain-containing protein [Azospirillum canadense]MCW2242973.1 soluble lytic murein transglycosylase-like protein [Azospirillum canadense]
MIGRGAMAAALALLALWGGSASAQMAAQPPGGPALFQCTRHFRNSEAMYGIPRGILHAMSVVESGRAGMPWPWALNVSGMPRFPATRSEALRLMHDEVGTLRADVAVGCMQIYTRWHAGSFAADEDILDPAINVTYAARFLRELYDRHGSWTEAVRRYHASDPAAQDTYLCQVLDRRVRLGYQRPTPDMQRLCGGKPS